jgi:hypothetical protein
MKTFLKIAAASGIGVLITAVAWMIKPKSPEQKLRALFADVSAGAPPYTAIRAIGEPPMDAVRGTFFTTTLELTEAQLGTMVSHYRVNRHELLSHQGTTTTSSSRLNPSYPWVLTLKGAPLPSPSSSYEVTIMAAQPD